MEVSQPIVQQHTDTIVMKTATDLGKANDKQMDKKEELHKQ
ncbi:hypothetical protein [Clostridium estertheticum]|nr:hypothetical protein [Clostridium estertheticum]